MKKLSLKSKILLSAILLGGGIAGAHTISNAPSLVDSTYDWTGTPEAPEHPSANLSDKTIEQAQDYFGCDGDQETCATGTRVSGNGSLNAEIKLN